MITFLDSKVHSLYRMDFKGYVKMLKDFIRGGPKLYKKFLFFVLNDSGNGKLCEHDLFSLMEQFKQRDEIYFYQDLFNMGRVNNDYKIMTDKSDYIFFEGFNEDFSRVVKVLNDKKKMEAYFQEKSPRSHMYFKGSQ